MKFCAECKYYEKDGVTVGNRKQSACKREGAKETAMLERNLGECGLEAQFWEERK